jgi:hypothetical protein
MVGLMVVLDTFYFDPFRYMLFCSSKSKLNNDLYRNFFKKKSLL